MDETVLIVDDEVDLLTTLEYNFKREGFRTQTVDSGRAALAAAAKDPRPDLILLDLMLPDLSGIEVCRRLRDDAATCHIPIIMLTAKSEEFDRVVGFEVGADDYVAKPFSVRELILRARAVLRRASAEPSAKPGGILEAGELRLDPGRHRAWASGVEVALTALEFRLLEAFLSRRGRVQRRETLLADVWGINADVTTRTVDTHVKRLREKLGEAGTAIETLRGVGYRLRDHTAGEGGDER